VLRRRGDHGPEALEELCAEQEATGDTPKARIATLSSKVVLPYDLVAGLDDLRLLGNEAAHIESTVCNKVGREAVEIGIEVAKEVLQGVYQMSELLGRLRNLQARQTP
jgi:hypothetical protein